ncbi:MAG: YHS domain-containing protein [Gammaproteobacteria bacterium]|nr:YHS domain-containing protein [Gammaproteobacteria bacterium]
MTFKSTLLAFVVLIGLSTSAMAGDHTHSAPAVQGYDVVSYQTGKRPVRGNGHYLAVHEGATYLFSSKANQEKFEANPAKYAPAYNGYCAFGVSVGEKFVGDPEVWRVIDGKLYLNLDAGIQDMWLKDVPGRIASADDKWKKIASKDPASL